MSNVTKIFGEFFDCSLIGKHRIVFILFEVLFKKTSFSALSTSSEYISKLLRHFPNSAIVIHLLFDLFNLFCNEAGNGVDFTRFGNSLDILSFLFMTADWWEVVLFVKINLFLLLRHVLEVYVRSSLANAGAAQFHLLLLVNYELSISAEYTFKSGYY